MWNGHIYHSSEQYIQHQKAIHCGDTTAANDIMSCKTALQCKRASKNIENYNSDEWSRYAETECIKGLLAKFDQNPKLKTILLNTGTKTLVECSWDKIWGTGYPLSHPDCLDAEKWESAGLLGTLLMAVHEKLQATDAEHSLLPLPSSTSTLPDQTNPPPLPDHMEIDSVASASANK